MERALVVLAAALIAVSGTEWTVRVRERRRVIEGATLELGMLVPHVIAPISELWKEADRPETGIGSEWYQHQERAESLLTEARARTRWPLRRHREIRREVEDLYARVAAAQIEWVLNRKLVAREEFPEISVAHLVAAVFGEKPYLDEAINFYRKNGYKRRPNGS